MSEDYDGRQYVGMDLHRRRSVLVRMTEAGQSLETVRIVNDCEQLAAVMHKVLQTDPAVWPEQRLANEIAHRKARRYLRLEKELF